MWAQAVGCSSTAKSSSEPGQIITGCELLEFSSNIINHKESQLKIWLDAVHGELEHGNLIVIERPTLENQYGQFRYDPRHVYNVYSSSPGSSETWAEDVNAGRDPAHGW
jgi:hypothetical protein